MLKVADTVASAQRPRCHRWFAAFFAFGAVMCAVTLALLAFPGSALDSLWRLNPEAQRALQSLGSWSFLLMSTVGTACVLAAIGLWRGSIWGTWLAVAILVANVIGDVINVSLRQDYRALIGLPIAAAMIFFLMQSGDRAKGFRSRRKGG